SLTELVELVGVGPYALIRSFGVRPNPAVELRDEKSCCVLPVTVPVAYACESCHVYDACACQTLENRLFSCTKKALNCWLKSARLTTSNRLAEDADVRLYAVIGYATPRNTLLTTTGA